MIFRSELLSVYSIKQFLRDNLPILMENLLHVDYKSYFEDDGKSIISEISHNLVLVLKFFIRKCKADTFRKKKFGIDPNKVSNLESCVVKYEGEMESTCSLSESLKKFVPVIERNLWFYTVIMLNLIQLFIALCFLKQWHHKFYLSTVSGILQLCREQYNH